MSTRSPASVPGTTHDVQTQRDAVIAAIRDVIAGT
jgi:hypothetical protein